MSHKLYDEEVDVSSRVGKAQFFAIIACLALSILCSVLWVFLLLWPQLLHVFK